MEMDYASFVQQNQMSPLDYYLESLNFQSFTSETSNEFINNQRSESSLSYSERPMKQMKTNSWSSCTTEQSTPSHIISFENSISSPAIPKIEIVSDINLPGLISHQSRASPSTTRNALQAQDHVIAERKRREKLSQRFIALSSLIPGLKKTDKASVLGDAIKYIQKLHERVKMLEEQSAKKSVESMVIVKKSKISSDDEYSSSDENFDSQLHLPHIEARVSDRDVLIRIHCQNNKGCVVNILNQIEKLPLTVVNSNVLTFGNSTLDITVIAQMEVGVETTVKDLVKSLKQALHKFM